jgi:hypothetical protein
MTRLASRTQAACRRFARVVAMLILGSGAGCEAMNVHPWDRDLLAEPKMQLNPHPVLRAIDDHIYFSKEGSTGGDDVGGGGCGCN